MSRRPAPSEQMFGSDSFLDVVANVVGILIILLVIAGVRVGRAPIILNALRSAIGATGTSDEPPAMKRTGPDDDSAKMRRQEFATLQSQAKSLETDLDKLRRAAEQHESQINTLQSQGAATRDRAVALSSTLADELTALEQNQKRTKELSDTAQAVRVRLQKREAEVAAAEQQTQHVETLEHRITPVSRVIRENETELHFQCLGGKVAVVPVEELIERMKSQMERQKNFITRTRRYSGSVGPSRGFSMNYIVEREEGTTLDQMLHGGGVVRFSVSQWEIVPEPDLDAEVTDAAVQPASAFRNELRKARPESTITFWVYPDSFAMYRKLQAIAHREGFTVAARPLPAGVRIMGSPNGTRSAAQ